MLRAAWVLTGLVVVGSGCVQSGAVDCGDGTMCPQGSVCDPRGRCLRPEQTAACEGLEELANCAIESRQGTCRDGACELWACGDGFINGNDSCDTLDLGDATCKTAGFYAAEGLACTTLCTFDTSQCGGGRCGDNIVNGPELCDTTTNKTCISIGFDGGSVACNDTCGLSINDCSRFGWNPEALTSLVALAVGGASASDHWAVGADGRANRFDGAFWTPYPTGVTNDLVAVWGIAVDDVWAVGQGESSSNPALLLAFDGTAWAPVTGAPAADYVDIWASGPNAVFAATSASGVQTFNGTAWSELGVLNRKALRIRGSSPTDIWVATETDALHGDLMHWNGTAWSPSTLVNTKVLFLDVNAPDDVWVIGHDNTSPTNGVIGHFDGVAWRTWRTSGEVYNNIAATAPNDAWIAAADGAMRHYDGVGWVTTTSIGQSPSGLAAISGLHAFNAIELVAVSTLNLAYRYRGQAYGRFEPLPFPDPFAASVNRTMWGTSATNLWVGTGKGEVFHFDGTAWTLSLKIDPDGLVAATSIWGTSATDVWVSTIDGRVFQLAGATWIEHDVNPGVALHEIWGSSSGDVWVFGLGGAYHYTGGTSWPRTALSNTFVLGAEGSGPNDIYAVTMPDVNGDALWHFDGTAWGPVARTGAGAFNPTTRLENVVAITPNLVFVVAANGHIHRWDGTSWTDDMVEATAELKFLSGSAVDDVVAASERELFHWDNRQWSAMRPPIDFVPNTPDYLPMADLLVSPGRVDMLLQKFRIRTLQRTRPLRCRDKETNCTDGVDDDCDGVVDNACMP